MNNLDKKAAHAFTDGRKNGGSRRMFLRGAAGAVLAIPFLGSIAPKESSAGSVGKARRFVAFGTSHGGVRSTNMLPAQSTLTDTLSYAGQNVRRGDLVLDVALGKASLSPVISGASTVLTQSLASKMNLLRGLDVARYIAHNSGSHLGNVTSSTLPTQEPLVRPTIDQILAYSDAFYPSVPKLRSMNVAASNSISVGRQNPTDIDSPLQTTPGSDSVFDLFNAVYTPPDPREIKRPPVVDSVLADYKRIRNGKRISQADRDRLDAHIARLDDLDASLNAVQSCGLVKPPSEEPIGPYHGDYFTNPDTQAKFINAYADVMLVALSCDTCRIGTISAEVLMDYAGPDEWHNDIAHRADQTTPLDPFPNVNAQEYIRDSSQQFFERIYLRFISQLDAIDDGDGQTLLDSSLVAWTQEAGIRTHDNLDLMIVLAGSGAGTMKTGNFCDYRDLTGPKMYEASNDESHVGLMLMQYHGSLLQAMGLDPASYEEGEYGGYGPMVHNQGDFWWFPPEPWTEQVKHAAHDFLPFLKA
jgi:hypothetical protein